MSASTVFAHGIASGDPTTDRVMLWTHVTADADSVPVSCTVARDPELSDVVASGEATAEAEHDHTVHVDVTGLEPGMTYHYGFNAEGEDSPVGRTWTLRSDADRLRFAMCSCAKHNAGFFNAYARIAERDDLDFLLHLGDYIYEAGNTPAKGQTPGADIGRDFDPLEECRTLDEYRTRYRQYHRDPDVQALHRALPIIPTLDDHELADGAGRRLGCARSQASRPLGGPQGGGLPGSLGVAAGAAAGPRRHHPRLPEGRGRRSRRHLPARHPLPA